MLRVYTQSRTHQLGRAEENIDSFRQTLWANCEVSCGEHKMNNTNRSRSEYRNQIFVGIRLYMWLFDVHIGTRKPIHRHRLHTRAHGRNICVNCVLAHFDSKFQTNAYPRQMDFLIYHLAYMVHIDALVILLIAFGCVWKYCIENHRHSCIQFAIILLLFQGLVNRLKMKNKIITFLPSKIENKYKRNEWRKKQNGYYVWKMGRT